MEAYKVTDVVIVGAGLIGMELAEAFHKQGLTVNIVEMQDRYSAADAGSGNG